MNTECFVEDIDDVADGLIPDSRIVELIDELELVKDVIERIRIEL
ncbi:hypothetical protein [Nitrosomonas marina]|uniref:Uncharacterized protein n=1 Tax=Nitrosomonas marina TaxID=917 RepID=A0A1H8B3B5_9PROT|nr:hypothetical protein [Nitrosomonas marina]SEM77422.1 hypothetical protein SAMN05216325_10284 [Nitrosomonas marina]